jgi:hypothetical protein
LGKRIDREFIIKEIKANRSFYIKTRTGIIRRVYPARSVLKECIKCSFPTMEIINKKENIEVLGCYYCANTIHRSISPNSKGAKAPSFIKPTKTELKMSSVL